MIQTCQALGIEFASKLLSSQSSRQIPCFFQKNIVHFIATYKEVIYLKTFRLDEMEQYILKNGTVSLQALTERFDVSISTVRQDVAALVRKGTVKKIYGGVSSVRPNRLVPFDARKARQHEKKQAIGKHAASLLQDHDILFLDSGTTTLEVIPHIPPDKRITVLTHNLSALVAAAAYDHIDVICLPGRMDRRTNAFLAADLRYLEQYNITVAMMAVTGISGGGDVTNSSLIECEIKRTAVVKSDRAYLLADSGKFERVSLTSYAKLNQFTGLVTDSDLSAEAKKLCREAEIDLHIIDA